MIHTEVYYRLTYMDRCSRKSLKGSTFSPNILRGWSDPPRDSGRTALRFGREEKCFERSLGRVPAWRWGESVMLELFFEALKVWRFDGIFVGFYSIAWFLLCYAVIGFLHFFPFCIVKTFFCFCVLVVCLLLCRWLLVGFRIAAIFLSWCVYICLTFFWKICFSIDWFQAANQVVLCVVVL